MYFQMWPYIQDLARRGEWYRLIREAIWFACVRPFPWRGLARRARDVVARSSGQFELPRWIASDFAKRTHMSTRWSEFRGLTMPAENHLARPKGHASMLLPQWTRMFEILDPGVTHSHVEVRYPYLDLEVVNFILATPVFPWSYKKSLLRKMMVGRIPDEILSRPKTPLAADPVVKTLRNQEQDWPSRRTLNDRTAQFVNPSNLQLFRDTMSSRDLVPFFLDAWLKGVQ